MITSRTLSTPTPSFLDVVMPKEHGSWSLAFEPVALGLLAAPSPAGFCLAIAVAAGFFARRPLRSVFRESRVERRNAALRALMTCALAATAALGGAVVLGGVAWLGWLIPVALAGGVFLFFDVRGAGREEISEVAGATAFATLPAAFAALDGWSQAAGVALALMMLGRAVPTVMTIRACLRGAKTGRWNFSPAVISASIAFVAGLWLARVGLAPAVGAALLGCFLIRTVVLQLLRRRAFRASALGMAEAVAGVVYVVVLAVSFRL